MRKKLTQKERREVYEKTGGRCAYCGCKIPFKGFHADHVLCLKNYEYMDDELGLKVDSVENMLPSCRSCNKYKATFDLETFREMLSGIPKRLVRDVSTYSIAVRYGMVEEHEGKIKFYFEKIGLKVKTREEAKK